MTNEEAIEIVKTYMMLDDCFVKGAGDMAISALEKQIPQKASTHFKENGYFLCNNKAIRYPLISFKDLLYCPICGKALDWSKENDD